MKIKRKKVAGLDAISSRLLRDCVVQLCGVVLHIFNLSLEKVPVPWKTCVVQLPKTVQPREPNHFRPVALTSHLVRTMERIVFNRHGPLVRTDVDSLDDTGIYLLH